MAGDMRIQPGGSLNLPAAAVRAIGDRPLRLAACSERHLLLEAADTPEHVLLTGTLGAIGVIDLLSFCNQFHKSGVLHFRLAGGDRLLHFCNGEIVCAASTFPREEIGEILYDLGRVERESLQAARHRAGSRRPLDELLLAEGLVSAQDLWSAARCLVESIVCNLCACHEGSFVLSDRQPAGELAKRPARGTQALILEAVQRFDERALYLQSLGSLDAVPVATGAVSDNLDGPARRMLTLIAAGSLPAREVLRRSGAGEAAGLSLLSRLVEQRLVTMQAAPPGEVDDELAGIIAVFNGVLTAMYRAVAPRDPQFAGQVGRFLRDLPPPFGCVFSQIDLSADGSLDGGRLTANLAGLAPDNRRRLLVEAVNELVYMECLAVRRELGAEGSALIRRVQDVVQRVQILLGRRDHG